MKSGLLMLAIVRDKPGLRAPWPAEAGPPAQGPCCVLHPGESGDTTIAVVTMISIVSHYCNWKGKLYFQQQKTNFFDKECIKKKHAAAVRPLPFYQ